MLRSKLAGAVPIRRAAIKSLATYVPPRVLTNADLEKLVDTTDEWIMQRTGIRERHIVDPGVATSTSPRRPRSRPFAAPGSRRTTSISSSSAP